MNGSGSASGAVSDTFTAIENLTGTPNDDTMLAVWTGTASFIRAATAPTPCSPLDDDLLDTINGGAGADTCTSRPRRHGDQLRIGAGVRVGR